MVVAALATLAALPSAAQAQSPYADVVASTPGLTAYWRLDESAGTVAHDAKGAADGTYAGGPGLARPGGAERGRRHGRPLRRRRRRDAGRRDGDRHAGGVVLLGGRRRAHARLDHLRRLDRRLRQRRARRLPRRRHHVHDAAGHRGRPRRLASHRRHRRRRRDGLLPRRRAGAQRHGRRGDRAGDALARDAQRHEQPVHARARGRGRGLRHRPAGRDGPRALRGRTRRDRHRRRPPRPPA